MSSKLFSILLVSSLLLGCIGKVGEEPPPQEAQEFSGTECLTDAMPVAKEFLEGTAKDKDLMAAWDCVSLAIEKFKRYVRGSSSDKYTAQELSTFLEANFFSKDKGPKKKVSVELQRELMKIKQLFVGGSLEYVTRNELDRSLEVFDFLKSQSLKINPYMKILTLKWVVTNSNQADSRYFEEGNQVIQEVSKDLAGVVLKNSLSYNLDDFTNLMQEFSEFYGENWESVENIRTFMPVVKKVKRAIAGGDESMVAPEEWRSFVLLGARGYIQYLRYYYFIKSASETNTGFKLSYIARSFEDGFSVFEDLVQEKPGGLVTKEEVSDILFTFSQVWPDFKVSEALIDEVMKLKVLAFGGSTEAWSTEDFETAKLKVSRLKAILERFLPYYDVYGLNWDPSFMDEEDAEKFFNEAQFSLESSAQELGALLESEYSFQDFYNLVKEIENLYADEKILDQDSKKFAESIEKFLPLVREVKNVIYSQNDDYISKDSWSSFLRFSARAFSEYLYYEYFTSRLSIDSEKGIASLDILVVRASAILKDMMALKPMDGFSKKELMGILIQLKALDFLPEELTEKDIESILTAALENILLDPQVRLSGKGPGNLNRSSIDLILREFKIWVEGQRVGIKAFSLKPEWTVSEMQKFIAEELKNVGQDVVRASALRELAITFGSSVPMTVNSKKFFNISSRKAWPYDLESFKKLNLHRAIIRAALNAYVNDLGRIQRYEGLNLAEAEYAFNQLKSIFVSIGLLQPTNLTFMSSRFREANIFTPRSDGNSLVSFAEGVDLVSILWGGVNVHLELSESLQNSFIETDVGILACLPAGTKPNLQTKISVRCLRKVYYEKMPLVMDNVPEYLRYMKNEPRGVWTFYFDNVLKAAGYVPSGGNDFMNYSDVSLIPQVVQYIEMVYSRFDRNGDGYISTPDAMRAFPAFKGIIMELAQDQLRKGDLDEDDLDDVFTFILRYGKPPETVGEKLRFLLQWKGRPERWDVWADRTKLASILGYIADQLAKAQQPKQAPNTQSLGAR